MNRKQLFDLIRAKKSFLCVGLDSDIEKLPPHLLEFSDPVFEFNKAIIDATIDLTIAYKPNLAFYESRGIAGWHTLEKTIRYLKQFGDNVFTIADAKRGDIGNTSLLYAKAFLAGGNDGLDFDAVTVAPYMGSDSVTPFLSYENKWAIILGLTSNKGAQDFQFLESEQKKLYESVLKKSSSWGTVDNIMYVIGATQAHTLKEIRQIIPDHFLLIPGIGAQGGSLDEVVANGMNQQCGLIVNASRSIIFASKDKDFDKNARSEALTVQTQMAQHLANYNII
ncbi:MAG: orotidine-5'-phosphate decarboxylase [Bacteroidales bacterium]|nr:orotidine-5'-phosphate decarboxylase [Bacteroidales bacterium]